MWLEHMFYRESPRAVPHIPYDPEWSLSDPEKTLVWLYADTCNGMLNVIATYSMPCPDSRLF